MAGKSIASISAANDRTNGNSNRVNHECGAFGEYITSKAALQIHIPDHMSFEAAATLGVATITIVRRALFWPVSPTDSTIANGLTNRH